MRKLQDQPEPDCSGSISSEGAAFESSSGWETEVEFTEYRKNKDVDYKIIQLANSKVSLRNLFDKYKIKFTEVYSASGWTHKARCPFKEHRDTSPSFGFNTIENRFNCFGCQRNGGSVQFIAFIDGTPQIEVAKRLLLSYGSLEDVITELEELDDEEDRTDNLLFEFSQCVRSFNKKHVDDSEALIFSDKVVWSLDVYLTKNVLYGSVVLENLEVRIDKLKEHLNSFGDPNE